ncbi:hypothetical protein MG1601_628 [Mycoplasmoides gallisepticum]
MIKAAGDNGQVLYSQPIYWVNRKWAETFDTKKVSNAIKALEAF